MLKTTMGVLIINSICTLNCKRCITKTPYHVNSQNYAFENIAEEITDFFEIFDEVDHFDLEGGETLLHPDLQKIIIKSLEYKRQYSQLNILTNGTIVPNDDILQACYNQPILFIIDDYGPLSVNKEELISKLEQYSIKYRVDVYYGENQYYGGWVDFGDMTYKQYSKLELNEVFLNCRSGQCGAPYIKNGKIFLCPMQASTTDHIELIKGEYIDLKDSSCSIEEKRSIAEQFGSKPIQTCRYCTGFNVNSERHMAAEQIELSNITSVKKFVTN